ncbi:hypothetical protein HYFRA_00006687 [Hymenoscyphus fraxineus]|uniref:DNA repair metallo-beta-lactamase domain-containing protein n=1 Tax=Hymenoscyphus fraxineus TaxID=746836 RepID=A0A9N9PS47_9HELO|nr:hypothetical protein HYFRA_00006687 [Hymenoscyphus fraxineus]
MFRKPRENANRPTTTNIRPSTGRPPTPPGNSKSPQSSYTMAPSSSVKPLTPRPNSKSNTAASSRQSTKKTPAKPLVKTPAKPNASILTFFKKVDNPLNDESIFLSHGANHLQMPRRAKVVQDSDVEEEFDDLYGVEDDVRFNESAGSVKRRKMSKEDLSIEGDTIVVDAPKVDTEDENTTRPSISSKQTTPTPPSHTEPQAAKSKSKPKKSKKRGPFLSDSESDYETYHKPKKEAHDNEPVQEKREFRERVKKETEDVNPVTETLPAVKDSVVASKPKSTTPKPIAETAKPLNFKRKRVPIAEAQAKWEAMQPKNSRSPSYSSEGGSTSSDKGKQPTNAMASGKGKEPAIELDTELPSVFPVAADTADAIPNLKKEATSVDDWGNFDDNDESLDEFNDGEEFIERKWMEEQARLEAMEQEEEFNGFDDDITDLDVPDQEIIPACPICDTSLSGLSSDDASRHVNACLDGKPIPLPKAAKLEKPLKSEKPEVKYMPVDAKNRFARKAGVPRPGQANPIEVGSAGPSSGSAFSKLMSGKAEDAAWATAAATENASRGKPAYQRTCPFYKIMPGFFICVDAFRYGAVQGCNGYFLSHFHSDHYVGLTSTWCHGPIYCSKVTANLVKQQLRVDPKWVVALDFDVKSEVPKTEGVSVTMIPANHCPGSSLFLFEKVIGKGPTPKVQRILHCGDFRACPAHIANPLLMPDLVDSLSGKIKQQKIDVCYLDTTYLNPRYAFPSQEDVVKACADMCVSLKKERAEESDAWETAKRERAGSGMNKFVNSTSAIKAEDNSIAMSLGSSKDSKPRGRLLVVCGTYSIGKERICMGIARALDCKIYAPPGKMRICAALEDPELMSRMTSDPREAQIHMQMLMEIRAETLQEYLNGYKPYFSRVVGFRPSGWNYKPPNSRFTDSPSIQTIIHSPNWRSTYTLQDLVPQRGSTREASCFGVPYSEHSSFRELTMFVCALRIEKVVPTVNVGSAASRAKMKGWIERWLAERRKNGVLRVGDGDGCVRW